MSFLRLPTIGQFKRGGQKRQYNPQLLTLAYEEVKQGTSVYKAAKLYGIPDSTLRDKFRGPMQPAPEGDTFNIKSGPSTTLSLGEENKLAAHCIYMASIGYGYSRNEFINLATDYAVSLKKKSVCDPPFAQSWYGGFKNRHPEVSLAKPQKLSLVRAKCTSAEVLNKYFSALEKVMVAHQLMDKPENIWNVDETGLLMEHRPTNVICQTGTTPQAVTSNRGKTVTIIAAGSAVGSRIPPYYVFPGKRWIESLLDGACPGAAGTVSETGWSNSLVFLDFLESHFLKHVPNNGSPILLLFDGHKSHVNLTLKEWGEAHNMVFFVIPPHTSHVTQPLDVGCFGPLKRVYHSECQAFMRKTPGIQINRLNVARMSSTAYNKGMTPENIISSFRKSGIFPLERKQISPEKTAPSSIYLETETNETAKSQNETTENETATSEIMETTENEMDKVSFLDQRKITKVTESEKKRKHQPSLQGNMMSPSKQSLLKRPEFKAEKTTKGKRSNKSVKKSTEKLSAPSPKPCTSGQNFRSSGIPLDSDTDSCLDDVVDESELCCVCGKLSPDAFNNAYTVEFINWGQCDSCERWVHLKYCTTVRVIRRGTSFLCPFCDKAA